MEGPQRAHCMMQVQRQRKARLIKVYRQDFVNNLQSEAIAATEQRGLFYLRRKALGRSQGTISCLEEKV